MPDWSIGDPELPPAFSRPVEVTIAGYVMLGLACIAIACGCLLGVQLANAESDLLPEPRVLLGGMLVIFAAVNGPFGYNLLQGRQWARIASIVLFCASIAVTIVDASLGGLPVELFIVGFYAMPIVLINTRDARAYFRSPA